jgi:hypothetical protein
VPELTPTEANPPSVGASLDTPPNRHQHQVQIFGLPTDVQVRQISHGVLWFPIKNLVLKVNPIVKQVLIADTLSGDRLRVDLIHCTLLFKTIVMKSTGKEPLIFSCFNASYEGRLEPGDDPQLFLKIAEHQIRLKF